MARSVLELDPTRAMELHGLDRDGAYELARTIIAKHGGANVKPEALSAMFDELIDNGFGLIPPSPGGSSSVN